MSDAPDRPGVLEELIAGRQVQPHHVPSCRAACEPAVLSGADAVLVCGTDVDQAPSGRHELQLLSDALASHHLTGVLFGHAPTGRGEDERLASVPADISADELWGRLATIKHYQPLLRHVEDQVAVMQRLGKKLNQHFVEVDQELRLASRLQRDFLPRRLPELADLRFAALYRPATWVSGDVYDVRRLDESHLGFYLADAVGHGVAAGLLTMFIRQSITGKHIGADGYRIESPESVLTDLNVQLAQQELPNCQFVTACYGVVDVRTHAVRIARGGHPHPIHVTSRGAFDEVRTVGGLLGVFPDETFPEIEISLEPGDKLVLYSDGLEDILLEPRTRASETVQLTSHFQDMLRLPSEECVSALAAFMDRSEGSLEPADDQTCLIVERLPAS